MQKTVSEPLDGMLDAGAFDHINADTDHAHLVTSADRPGVVGQALRLPGPVTATGAVALQCWRTLARSFGIIRHGGEHFLNRIFQTHPHRTRYDRVANIEFAQTWNLVDERDVFVIDAVASVDLHIGF